MDNEHKPVWGYMGRPIKMHGDGKNGVARVELERDRMVCIDLALKGHSFIVGSIGSGKSTTGRVYTEELLEKMRALCGMILIDRMGIFMTLATPNTNKRQLDNWNGELPGDVVPKGFEGITVWVPLGDAGKFLPGMYQRTFSLAAPEFTAGLFMFMFGKDLDDQQVALYGSCQEVLAGKKPRFTLADMVECAREHGKGMNYQQATIDALVSRLGYLGKLGLISNDAPSIKEMVREGEVSVLNLSQTAMPVAQVIVEFLVSKLYALRVMVFGQKQFAQMGNEVQLPAEYIPPVSIVIDEAHNYMDDPRSAIIKSVKEGRAIGLSITAISQETDLDKKFYKALTHLWVGSQTFAGEIQKIREMIPVRSKIKPNQFDEMVNTLDVGCWIYFNIKDKKNPGPFLCRVRPSKTLHLATTEVDNERKYFTDGGVPAMREKQPTRLDALEYDFAFDPSQPQFVAVCKGDPGYKLNERRYSVATGKHVWVDGTNTWALDRVAEEFLTAITAKGTRQAAIDTLQEEGVKQLTVLQLRYV